MTEHKHDFCRFKLVFGCKKRYKSLESSLLGTARRKALTRWPKKRYKDTHKASLKDWISIFQLSPGNRLLRIEQGGVASSTKVPPNLNQRESVKLEGGVKKGKQEPRDHHQTQHSPNSFATDSLELKLAYTAINEHTNTHKRLIF